MPTADYRPDPEDVGAYLYSRTRDSNGNLLGQFTDDTNPTDEQVETLIDTAVTTVANAVGADLEEGFWEAAESAVALYTAMLVELNFFPEQVTKGLSPYPQLEKLMKGVLDQLAASTDSNVVGGSTDHELPLFGFPEDQGGMVGWGSRW